MNIFKQKFTLVTMLAALSIGLISCPKTPPARTRLTSEQSIYLPGKGVKVRPGYDGEERFITEIVGIGLEQLGYEVEKIKTVSPPVLLHVAIGNGDLDFTTSHWEKLYEKFFARGGGTQKLEKVGVITPNLLQGYKIDRKTADKYQITSLAQLKDPRLAHLFDTNRNGKADIVYCPVGSGCDEVIENHLKAYGLQDTVEYLRGDVETQIADIITRYKQGEPVLYYMWTPSWLDENMPDVVWLEVPFTAYLKSMGDYTAKDTSFQGKNLGFAVDKLRIVANKEFLQANPAAKHFFELVQIPIADISSELTLIHKGENTPEDMRHHAQKWIQQHQQLFDHWVAAARTAGKAPR
jgi:ABC-type proline/glycine betaine transport system substrate-binding protein